MSGRLYLDEIYSKSGQTKVLDTTSFDANNNFEASNTGFNLNYQSANAALNIVQSGTGDALRVNSNALVVDSSGKVGIGIDPTYKFEVAMNGTTNSKTYTKFGGASNKFNHFVIDSGEGTDDTRAILDFNHGSVNSASISTNYRTSDNASDYLQIITREADQDIQLTATGEIIISAGSSETMRINSDGTISQNGVGKAAFSFYRPGSTEVTVRCWLPNYSTAIIKFTYSHTNDTDGFAFMEVAVNNSYGRIRTQTIASKMTFAFGTVSFGAAADNAGGNSNYVYFTVPAANASGSYGAITMEGTSRYWFEKI